MDWLDIFDLGVDIAKVGFSVYSSFNAADNAADALRAQAALTRESAELQAAFLELEGEYAEKIGEFNGRVYDQQADVAIDLSKRETGIIGYQSQIEQTIAKRRFTQIQSRVVAAVGASGIELEGSPVRVLLDNAVEADYEFSVRDWRTEVAQENRTLQGDLEAWTAKVNATKERYIGQLTKALKFREADLTRDFGAQAAEIEASA